MKILLALARLGTLLAVLGLVAACGGGGGGGNGGTTGGDAAGGDTGSGGTQTGGTSTDDSAPGTPASKSAWSVAIQDFQGTGDPATAFAYDAQNYLVRQQTIHGTQVTVAVHNATPAGGGPAATDFADACLAFFRAAWDAFGGFPYDGYEFKVRAPGDAQGFSLSPGGVIIDAADYAGPGVYEFVAHEMFHAWNGKIFEPRPDASDALFQTESWLVEGATVYYSFRVLGQTRGSAEFSTGMAGRWSQYEARRGTAADLSFAELAAQATGAESGENTYTIMLFARGAIVAYLLDEKLRAAGSSLDALMQKLYVDSGLAGRPWTEAEVEAAVRTLGGAAVADWLANAVSTNVALDTTFDGRFTLF